MKHITPPIITIVLVSITAVLLISYAVENHLKKNIAKCEKYAEMLSGECVKNDPEGELFVRVDGKSYRIATARYMAFNIQ